MARPKKDYPSYRQHSSGQAIVTLTDPSGERQDVLLGDYNSGESKQKYDEVINRWIANGRRLENLTGEEGISNNELFVMYLRQARTRYETRGKKTTGQIANLKAVIEISSKLYGSEPAKSFSPKRLKACRGVMIERKWSRSHINRQVNRIRQIYRWGVAEELVPPELIYGLTSVAALKPGEEGVKDRPKVKPADEAFVRESMKHMQPAVATMVELMLLTGCRAGELVITRTCDIDQSGNVWLYHPHYHKTEKHGHSRTIYIGPKAQEILACWLQPDNPEVYLFSPRKAEEVRNSVRNQNRKTPKWPSHMIRNRRKRKVKRKSPFRDRYDVDSLRRANVYACEKIDRLERKAKGDKRWKVKAKERLIKPWHPHQLRHTAGTNIRRESGIEMARIILGHNSIEVSQIYAEADLEKAKLIMSKIG